MNSVAILIVNYNGEIYIRDCLDSLLKQTNQCFDIFIVDNHSQDSSTVIIENEYPMVTMIKNDLNYGFSKANNIGAEKILELGYSYIILLNEDTICDSCMVDILIKNRNESIVLTPAIYTDRLYRNIWGGGSGDIDYHRIKTIYKKQYNNGLTEISFATGCCLIINTAIVKEIGLFDEDYYMYWEDTDLSARLSHNGIKMYVVEDAKLWHRGQRNIKGEYKDYYKIRNRWLFIKKHRALCKILPVQAIFQDIKRFTIESYPGDAKLMMIFFQGLRDYCLMKFGQRHI